MIREYTQQNVYDALIERLHYIFEEFDNIIMSFSGGKDSGLLLNIVIDFKRKYYPDRKIALFHQDFEAQYCYTTEYVERTFERLKDEVEPYWVCLPMATRTALSNYEMYWYPWDDTKEKVWCRPMPDHPYVINLKNNPMTNYRYKMHQEDLAKQFSRFYRMTHGDKKTVCLLGIRADESLQRYSGFLNKKYGYGGKCWISRQFKDVWTASPMYDWATSDVWHANHIFGYDYNKLYDMYHMAGLKPDQMRVASPFSDSAKEALNVYRVLDPDMWSRLLCRVRGVNFGAVSTKNKIGGYKNLKLPEGHTWESYTKFLLDTLPARLRNNYISKFKTSIDFWHNTGGGLDAGVIKELIDRGYNIKLNGVSNYTVLKHSRVIFLDKIPDHTDDISASKDVPSWKRMCYCILKNDHVCRFMGFGITREQQKQVNELKKKYGRFGEDDEI